VKHQADSDQIIIKYLLNKMSVEERERFEDAYLTDGDLFEDVQALEAELIEDYVKGELSDSDSQSFERHYLTTEQDLARVENARRLVQTSSLKSMPPAAVADRLYRQPLSIFSRLWLLVKPYLTPEFGVVAILILLLGSGVILELLRRFAVVSQERAAFAQHAKDLEQQLAYEREQRLTLQAARDRLNDQLSALERQSAEPQESKDQIASLILAPNIRENGMLNRVHLSARTSLVEIRVNLEGQEAVNPRSYRVVVRAVESGDEIWVREGLKPQESRSVRYVVVKVPTERFKAARGRDFVLTLGVPATGEKGYEELEGCYFQVTSR
jgi:hypothetical protein